MKTRQILMPATLGIILLCADSVLAQGCASCYTTAAAGGTQTIHALRNGILVLLVPPALTFVGLMFLVRTWRTGADVHNLACPHAKKQIPRSSTPTSECCCNESLRRGR